MTSIKYVSKKEMKKATGLGMALGYTFPEKDLILLRKGLPAGLKKEVLEHEEEHLSKGEEGPFWGALGAAAAKWGPAIGSALGGLFGGGEQEQPVPFSATKNRERDRLYALSSAMFGANPNGRSSKVNPNAGTGSGGFEALYTNPENFMSYGPTPFGPANPFELAGIAGLGDFATGQFPELYQGLGGAISQGLNNNPMSAYNDAFQSTLPAVTDALNNVPTVINPGFDPGAYGGLVGGQTQDAINSMMSGDLDLNLFQGAIDSYLQPAMEQFNEQLLPSFLRADQAATSGQSSAGALKAAQRTQEQIGEGLGAYLGGQLFNASQNAANRVGQGVGLQQGNLGLMGQFAGQNSMYDLNSQLANQDAYMNQTRNLLTGAGLGGNMAQSLNSSNMGWANMIPSLANLGMLGPQALSQAGALQRGITDPFYQYDFNAHMYNQQQPFDMANQWYNMLQGAQNPNTSATAQPTGGSPLVAGLSGLLANFPEVQTTPVGLGNSSNQLGNIKNQIISGITPEMLRNVGSY